MNEQLELNKPLPINLEGMKLENPAMLMTQDTFAVHIGVSIGVVGGWVDNGYLPTVKLGKRRLINLLKLREELLTDRVDLNGFNEVVS